VDLTRRRFLAGAGAAAVAVAAGCAGDDDSAAPTQPPTTAVLEAPALPAGANGDVFTLGVAAGDQTPDGFALWTRLAPQPLEANGGMPAADAEVVWEVAQDDSFAVVVAAGTATAPADHAHAVHVTVEDLEPDTAYAYRFRAGDHASTIGHARTFPTGDSSPDRIRFAMATCQDRASGYYAAHRAIASEPDLDLVVFLGDYIYEFPGPDTAGPDERVNLGPVPVTLDDYRRRYALYKTDLDLQAAHAAHAWLILWDDHEVENDYEGSQPGPSTPVEGFADRRAAAYQAWWEHQPTRLPAPTAAGLQLYREVAYGDLVRFLVLDVRQYGDPVPCRASSALDFGPTCAEREDLDRSLLGAGQEAWLRDVLPKGAAQWTAITQGVMFAGLNAGDPGGPAQYFLESWDGYPGARRRLVDDVVASGANNPVVLSGDYHASFVSDVRADPFDLSLPVVATEFLVTSISTFNFPTDYRGQNPQVRYFEPTSGYAVCDVTPGEWRTDFKYVSDVNDPDASVSTGATFLVADGSVVANRV
jgi:alkaline phosphatase D